MIKHSFEFSKYAQFNASELQVMGYGAMSLMAILRPKDFNNEDFKTEDEFLAAHKRAQNALEAMFRAKPYHNSGDRRGHGRFIEQRKCSFSRTSVKTPMF